MAEERAIDVQVGGSWYKDCAIQPIQYVLANNLGFCEGNVVKYITRWQKKGGLEDLAKAKHYIDLLLESQQVPAPTPYPELAEGWGVAIDEYREGMTSVRTESQKDTPPADEVPPVEAYLKPGAVETHLFRAKDLARDLAAGTRPMRYTDPELEGPDV